MKAIHENGKMAYVERLRGKEDDLVELGEIGKEVIYTRSFGRSPAVCTL